MVIIGGGPSSLTCCETLRKEGFEGQIILLTKERHPTYDRPKLSKALDIQPEQIYLRTSEFYKAINVELYLNTVSDYFNTIFMHLRIAQWQGVELRVVWHWVR